MGQTATGLAAGSARKARPCMVHQAGLQHGAWCGLCTEGDGWVAGPDKEGPEGNPRPGREI